MQRHRDKNATGASRHHVTPRVLRAHSALTAVEEARLERDSGSKWFEPQLQMIESNNANAWLQSSAYAVLSGRKKRGRCRRHPSSVRRGFSPPWTQPRARRLQVSSLSKFPFPPFLSFHYFITIDPVRPGDRAGKEEECPGLIASRWQASSLTLVVPLEVKKAMLFPNLFIPRHPCRAGKLE